MRVLVQRVSRARVLVDGNQVAETGHGLLLLVGAGKDDDSSDIDYLVHKISGLRIFEDDEGKMNLDIRQVQGQIMSVSQFTLYANTKKGNRPGFEEASPPDKANRLWMQFNAALKQQGIDVKEGVFAAHTQIELVNDGPVTIWLDSRDR